jgi:4-hydroxy-tetrahydrodipicolinate reductase
MADADPDVQVIAGIVRHPRDASDGIVLVTSATAVPEGTGAIIDFSVAGATLDIARGAASRGIPLVIGTTGLGDAEVKVLRGLSERIPIWYARNMSYGVAVVHDLLRQAARQLTGYDIELVEMHHRNKVDAPSGTALALAETMQREVAESRITTGRSGISKRNDLDIGIQSLRGGGNFGEHTVVFASDDEEIRISHRALSRSVFASGAIRAAKRIAGAEPGWYGPE